MPCNPVTLCRDLRTEIETKRINGITVFIIFLFEPLITAGRLLHIAFLKVMLLPHFEDVLEFAFQVWFQGLCCIRNG
jgi:hypothetical protein